MEFEGLLWGLCGVYGGACGDGGGGYAVRWTYSIYPIRN